MNFEELLGEVKKIKFEEKRAQSENYYEMVIASVDLATLTPILESYFGASFKPAGQRPSFAAEEYAKSYGGIQSGQTLYAHESGKTTELAFLWPWGNGTSVTVKIIRAPVDQFHEKTIS